MVLGKDSCNVSSEQKLSLDMSSVLYDEKQSFLWVWLASVGQCVINQTHEMKRIDSGNVNLIRCNCYIICYVAV